LAMLSFMQVPRAAKIIEGSHGKSYVKVLAAG
jgi:hypothetical protein